LVAKREDEAAFATMFDCLMRGNQGWAGDAAVLVIVAAVVRDEAEGELRPVHYYNAGLAVSQMVVEASANGLVVHQMGGIHKDKIREVYELPPEVDPIVAVAIGTIGDPEGLGEPLREREYAERVRKPLGEVVFNGRWDNPYLF
jgi:nitroreductase